MKVSTKSRYGLRAMLVLALNFEVKPVRLEEIAQEQNLSPKYLHTLLASLKTAGLIHCIRGQFGGYRLTCSPEQIHLSDVMIALEGPFVFSECVIDPGICADSEGCVTRKFWGDLGLAIEEYLGNITLGKLAEDHRNGAGNGNGNHPEPGLQKGCQKSKGNLGNFVGRQPRIN